MSIYMFIGTTLIYQVPCNQGYVFVSDLVDMPTINFKAWVSGNWFKERLILKILSIFELFYLKGPVCRI